MPNLVVNFQLPKNPINIGSYLKVPVVISQNAGFKIDDLDFIVSAGAKGGKVSLSRERDYDPKHPDIMLLAGYQPGKYSLRAVKKGSTTVLGQGTFQTTTKRLDKRAGPPIWFEGAIKGYTEGRAWGGGASGPQNFNVYPAVGTRRVAILFADTASERFTTDPVQLSAMRKRWKDAAQDGLPVGGKVISTAHYYREVSYNTFDLTADVFGPYQLAQTWAEIFAGNTPWVQMAITAADADVDYNNYDTIVVVVKSFTTAIPNVPGVWPHASQGVFTTAEGPKSFGVIAMPDDWAAPGNEIRIAATLAHEVGHNLGLSDLYAPNVPGRNLGDWDLMHGESRFPHFSIAERLMLGWVQPTWLTTFNFATAGAPVDQTVTLNPIELGVPPAGRKAGVEVRIADGWNYYFEYRKSQTSQIGEQALPTDDRMLGTDVISPPYLAPIVRPNILLLEVDSDGDGPVLGNGQDFRKIDQTNPSFPVEMRLDVSGISGSSANVRIRYGVIGKPDPSIRPWAPGPWQSPDIEIRNERNRVDPVGWFNVPWDGHDNTVVAKVKNGGTLDAPDVTVNFFVKDANVGGDPPETFLGSDTKSIPAGATVEFTTNWQVPREGHYCMVVRIPLYVMPGPPGMPPVGEMTEHNNLAQSNYDRFISRTSSAPSRETAQVTIGNPYPKPAIVLICASQNDGGNAPGNPPYYRSYLEHTWLRLKAGETRKVTVMFEGTGELNPQSDNRIQNDVKFVGYVYDPGEKPPHRMEVMGGWQAQIDQARAVRFNKFLTDGLKVTGILETVDTQQPVTSGRVIITQTVSKSAKEQYSNVRLNSNGKFTAKLRDNWKSVIAYYVPGVGFGDATSKRRVR